jgi:hypothetical protein
MNNNFENNADLDEITIPIHVYKELLKNGYRIKKMKYQEL